MTRRALITTAIVCVTTVISHSIGRSVYGLLLSAIKDDFGLTNAQAGRPSSGIFVLYVIGVLVVVVASPRFEPIAIMRTAVAFSVAGLIITATASGLGMLTVGVSLVGGAGAGIWMTAPVLATEYVSERRRGVIIGALTSSIGLANIAFGIGTSAWRRASNDDQLWRPIWWVALAFAAIVLVALTTVARFAKTDRVGSGALDLGIIRRIPHWQQVTIAYALFGGMSAGFGTFIVKAIEEHGGLNSETSPLIFSAMGIAGMLAAPAAGAWSDSVGRIFVMRCTLVLLAAANFAVAAGGPTLVVGGAILYSAGASAFPTLIATYVRDSLDNRSFSQALSIMTILFSIMAAILPTLMGVIADATSSFGWPYLLTALMPTAALMALAGIRGRQV